MKRRAFLGTIGSTASLGTLAYATRGASDTLEVRIWLSERAATYDGVADRIRAYLDETLALGYWTLETSIGGSVSVSTEAAARLTHRGEWPMALASGTLGGRDLEPASDVNLLVTDGGMERAPTGYGVPHIASVGGARHIAALESFDDIVVDDARSIVPNTTPARTMQVLLHEIGHALGLDHKDGVAFVHDGALVATPMLSSYAWDPTYERNASPCGTTIPASDDRKQMLSFAFSSCARRRLANYDGEIRF
ncbi:peptidase M10A and M12B matrixin and adamalysin [Natrinema zhouii]|uniref:Peptidase M10A and M12B matrixin and adamalysin n=1 Tax=Natrinema zhouii TaxID=1710539 RepID=A0A7D6GM89_9EURY|nr:peptidase M10A and M12B matrixin and adamalysin [Natrinema zhouii]QLK27800.1 peptidase M10A and M12B matrixin and adamalysin [Natrinema zhouii]